MLFKESTCSDYYVIVSLIKVYLQLSQLKATTLWLPLMKRIFNSSLFAFSQLIGRNTINIKYNNVYNSGVKGSLLKPKKGFTK